MKNLIKCPVWFLGLLWLSACTSSQDHHSNSAQPSSNSVELKQAAAGMVVTANPVATKTGAAILRAGGSSVDAAIGIQAVLSLVEPQSSGFGGGGYMVHFDNTTKQVDVYDGRETAPKNVSADMFLDQDDQSIGFIKAKTSGLSTGVPGMVAMLSLAHANHGKLPWGEHFADAIKLAN